jgi:predicted lipoprotein with Yx(FWY)xxD motif
MRIGTTARGPLLALTVLALAGCGSTTTPTASTAPSAPSSSSAPAAAADLKVADSPLGKIIVDSKGLTAYYFTKDKPNSGKSVCSGGCLTAWPSIAPASAAPTAEGVTAKLGTITRDDGTGQITVNGLPIYLYIKDKAAGDVTGQDVGKVWYVIAPDGTMITKKAAG